MCHDLRLVLQCGMRNSLLLQPHHYTCLLLVMGPLAFSALFALSGHVCVHVCVSVCLHCVCVSVCACASVETNARNHPSSSTLFFEVGSPDQTPSPPG